jgi:hypothetical protein
MGLPRSRRRRLINGWLEWGSLFLIATVAQELLSRGDHPVLTALEVGAQAIGWIALLGFAVLTGRDFLSG